MRASRPGERVFGLVMLALALAFLWQAHAIKGLESLSSPGAFPLAASAVMVIASILIVLDDRRRTADGDPIKAVLPPVLLIFFLLVLLFAVLLDRLGFLLAATAFLVASIGFLERRGTVRTLGVALLAVILVYIVFRLVFKVVLPEGIVPEREILAAIGDALAGLRGDQPEGGQP